MEPFDFEAAITARAAGIGLTLPRGAARVLADHARAVLARNAELHLTSITEPAAFAERHLGESLEGAALLPPDIAGILVDLGSGNGYPGLPVAAARPGLRPVLVEASRKKAAFLREVAALPGWPTEVAVVADPVQRAADLSGPLGRPARVLVTRAMGNWERLLPKLVPALADDGRVLLWAGEAVEAVARRAAWRRLRLLRRHPLPGRERSWIWLFRPAAATPPA